MDCCSNYHCTTWQERKRIISLLLSIPLAFSFLIRDKKREEEESAPYYNEKLQKCQFLRFTEEATISILSMEKRLDA